MNTNIKFDKEDDSITSSEVHNKKEFSAYISNLIINALENFDKVSSTFNGVYCEDLDVVNNAIDKLAELEEARKKNDANARDSILFKLLITSTSGLRYKMRRDILAMALKHKDIAEVMGEDFVESEANISKEEDMERCLIVAKATTVALILLFASSIGCVATITDNKDEDDDKDQVADETSTDND
jgi:hypothetical protein